LVELAEQRSPGAQEVYQFMLAVAMEESGLAKLIGTSQLDGRTHYTYRSASGDLFAVVRPEMDTLQETEMRVALEGILEDEGFGQA
jgi:hypothetical protein